MIAPVIWFLVILVAGSAVVAVAPGDTAAGVRAAVIGGGKAGVARVRQGGIPAPRKAASRGGTKAARRGGRAARKGDIAALVDAAYDDANRRHGGRHPKAASGGGNAARGGKAARRQGGIRDAIAAGWDERHAAGYGDAPLIDKWRRRRAELAGIFVGSPEFEGCCGCGRNKVDYVVFTGRGRRESYCEACFDGSATNRHARHVRLPETLVDAPIGATDKVPPPRVSGASVNPPQAPAAPVPDAPTTEQTTPGQCPTHRSPLVDGRCPTCDARMHAAWDEGQRRTAAGRRHLLDCGPDHVCPECRAKAAVIVGATPESPSVPPAPASTPDQGDPHRGERDHQPLRP